MKIERIQCHKLLGATVDGGWPEGHEPQDDLHTLVEVHTDEGLSGVGSVFTGCLLYTSPSPRDQRGSRMPSSA